MLSLRDWILKQQRDYVEPDPNRKGLNAEKQQELHEKIANGTINVGPITDHSMATRDLRPTGPSAEELGLAILSKTNGHRETKTLADSYFNDGIA